MAAPQQAQVYQTWFGIAGAGKAGANIKASHRYHQSHKILIVILELFGAPWSHFSPGILARLHR